MRFSNTLSLLLCGAALLCGGAQAQAVSLAVSADAGSLDTILDPVNHGDLTAVDRALANGASGDLAVLLRAQRAAAQHEARAATDPELLRLAEGGDPVLRRAALGILANAAFANADYTAAARAGRLRAEAEQASGDAAGVAEAERLWRLSELLAGRPAQQVIGAVAAETVPAATDRVGLPRLDVTVNGVAQEAVFDTGANLSVLSTETARRMGIEIMATETQVANGVDGTVGVRVGQGDLVIAGTTIRNVVFLIIDDAELTFPVPGGYDIRAIIGLPVMRALGRMRMERDGRFTVLPGAQASGAPNLVANGNDMFAAVEVGGRAMPLSLDTGANRTTLSARFAAANPAIVANLETQETRMSSAGGSERRTNANWANAPLALAGRSLTLTLPIALPDDGPEPAFYGTLGSDVLRRFDSYTLDFNAMRLELGEPVAG